MALIKSALEIAMERTKDVKSDPEKIRNRELVNEGKKLASDFLFDNETDEKKVRGIFKSSGKNDSERIKEGFRQILLSNMRLPRSDEYQEKTESIKKGLEIISSDPKNVGMIMEQITRFFEQYLKNREDLKEALKNQYAPRLMQKQKELAERYGQEVTIAPEQDPEFMELLNKNLSRMEQQYSASLEEAKKELVSSL